MKKATKKADADGFKAVVLRPIQAHGALDESSLNAMLENEFEDSTVVARTLAGLQKNDYVVRTDGYFQLSQKGDQWLRENGAALGLEEEQIGPDIRDGTDGTTPKRPYDAVKLKMEEKHVSVFQILRKMELGQIDLSPEFQRAFVWDVEKQSRLIESILIRIPLPSFYLDASNQTKWAVVDGLQRLTTLHRYCREEAFGLTGLQFLLELEGSKFSDLPPRYKVLIEDDTQLLLYNLLPGTPLEAKYTIFSRVNTGGVQLTPQEIRHALSQGRSTEYLRELALSSEFFAATQGAIESRRMADRELVLRALAFMLSGRQYYRKHNELDSFLLNAMGLMNELPESRLSELSNEFLSGLTKVHAVFGNYSFRKFWEINGRRGPINKALFEVWVSCVGPYSEEQLVDNELEIKTGFINMLAGDERFLKSISSSTGSPSAVDYRFESVAKMLSKVMS